MVAVALDAGWHDGRPESLGSHCGHIASDYKSAA